MKVYIVSKTNGKVEFVDKVFASQEDAQEYIDKKWEQQKPIIRMKALDFQRMNTQETIDSIVSTYGSIDLFLETIEPLFFEYTCMAFEVC